MQVKNKIKHSNSSKDKGKKSCDVKLFTVKAY
jgi:hypothetical protein